VKLTVADGLGVLLGVWLTVCEAVKLTVALGLGVPDGVQLGVEIAAVEEGVFDGVNDRVWLGV
jgi:hypothetical protein